MFAACSGAYTTTAYRPAAVTHSCPTHRSVSTAGSPSVATVRHAYPLASLAASTCRPVESPDTVTASSDERCHPDGSTLAGSGSWAGPGAALATAFDADCPVPAVVWAELAGAAAEPAAEVAAIADPCASDPASSTPPAITETRRSQRMTPPPGKGHWSRHCHPNRRRPIPQMSTFLVLCRGSSAWTRSRGR